MTFFFFFGLVLFHDKTQIERIWARENLFHLAMKSAHPVFQVHAVFVYTMKL